jgi:hypothetical protein
MTQLAFDLSPREAGETAAAACESKARRVSDFDSEGASRFIFGELVRHGPQSGETLTDSAKAHGYRPHDDRAFGGVFMRLARRKQIRCVGTCERRKGHGTSGGRVWEAVIA